MHNFLKKVLAVVAILVVSPGWVLAGVATQSLPVSATVPNDCAFSGGAATLNFGSYSPIGANATSNLDATGSFNISCTAGTTGSIALDLGSNASGATRRMSSGTNFLNYEIYTDSGHTTVWNNVNLVNYTAVSSAPVTQTIYGSVPGGQNVGAGNYTDTVTITVTF